MAADTRPFKSKEQDGQGNEVIIRDQQLVEQASQTTMASGEYFEIVDVDGRMAKIPKANMMSVVLEAIRLLLDDSGSNISAANITKILGLSASSIGNILPTDLASVLGAQLSIKKDFTTTIELTSENSTVIPLTGRYWFATYQCLSDGSYTHWGLISSHANGTVAHRIEPGEVQLAFEMVSGGLYVHNIKNSTLSFVFRFFYMGFD